MTQFHKIVLLPIVVSNCDYCWDGRNLCPQFDNTGGHPTCDMDIDILRYNKEGVVPKPKRCLQLRMQQEVKILPAPIDHEKTRRIKQCKNTTQE